MLSPDEELLDLPSVPRVRKTTAASSSNIDDGPDASRSASQQRTRKNRRRSRWSDAAPNELSVNHIQTVSKNPPVEQELRIPKLTSTTPQAGLMNPPSNADARSHRRRRSVSPQTVEDVEPRKRNRARKVVNDDDDDDDEENEDNERDEFIPRDDREEENDLPGHVSYDESGPRRKKRLGSSRHLKSPSTDIEHPNRAERKSKKPRTERSPDHHSRKKQKVKRAKKARAHRSRNSKDDEMANKDSDSPEYMSPSPLLSPELSSGSRDDSPVEPTEGRKEVRLTSRQRALQGEKIELEQLQSPKHKKKPSPKDDWTPDEDSEIARQQRAHLRRMVAEKKNKEKRAATVDKVLRGVTSKRKKISAANEAVAARAGDRLVNRGVLKGFVRLSSGPSGSYVAVAPGEPLPDGLNFGHVKVEYPRPCIIDPKTGKRIFT